LKRIALLLSFAGLLIYADIASRRPFPGNARVRISVHADAGRTTGLRLRITNAAGEYFAPLGHLTAPNPGARNANDLILGDNKDTPLTLYALVYDGAQIDLPPGRYHLEARHGYEYDIVRKDVDISAADGQTIAIPLHKYVDFEARGWYPGDTHIHFPDPAGVRYEMECEGLRVCSLLLYKGGLPNPPHPGDGTFINMAYFTGRLSPVSDGRHFVEVGEEFRSGRLAHLVFQNLRSVVWPVSTGGLKENGAGGYDWPLMLHAADDAHAQGALVTWAHWPYPSLEAPLDIALGRIDSVDLLTTGNPFEPHSELIDVYKMHGPRAFDTPPIDVYYAYLNCGFHLAASSGSDKMALNPPMGSARTYVKTNGPLTYQSWVEGIRAGHSFGSDYPLLEFSVNGKEPGDSIPLAPGKARLTVKARSSSLEPYEALEVIYNGKVVCTAKPAGEHFQAVIEDTVEVDRGGWIALRAHGPADGSKMLPYGPTWWQMPVFAHSSPIYLDMPGRPAPAADAARLFLDQLGYLRKWADQANFPASENQQEALALIAKAEGIYQKLAQR
jgi:hypothetical protein